MLTENEIHALNHARSILDQLDNDAMRASWKAPTRPTLEEGTAQDLGRVAAYAEAASHSIFMVLNTLSSHNVQKLTKAQLHNNTEEASGVRG